MPSSSRRASSWPFGVVRRLQPVDRVVGADVLERGDEQDLIEGTIVEREPANVGFGRLEADIARRKIDANELHARADERAEICRLGEGVADLEHATARSEPRQHPWNLDHTLVGSRRRLQPADSFSPRASAEAQCNRVVELHARARTRRSTRARG